ncbi:endonuclease/exonuclease/phosphatase family protein [Streptomyces sp. NPDC093249]|uniref:endonuclease/exonuclease/phosphatase family protein n=1 Tax=unclassified Streptomyces TaxID=2593676 RepID=UPI003804D4E8
MNLPLSPGAPAGIPENLPETSPAPALGNGPGPSAPTPAGRARSRATRALVGATAAWALLVVPGLSLSGRWWLWLLPDLVPPPAFVVVPLLLSALAYGLTGGRARRWLLAALVAVLLAGAGRAGLHWGALLPGGGPGPAPANALKVFSWNTLYWDTTDDPDAFHRFLRSKDADVYLLQEHLAWDGTHRETDRLDRLRAEFPGYHLVARGELVTLSRYPVVAAPPVGPGPAPADSAPWRERFEWNKVLRTDVDVAGTVVSFYNVHMPVQLDIERSPLSPDFYRVVRETDAVRREHYAALLADARANPRPLLISGDFNTTPAMGDLRGLRESFRDALSASSSFLPGTWGVAGAALWRIDWTFTDEGLRVHRYALVSPAGLSDHKGQELLVSPAG